MKKVSLITSFVACILLISSCASFLKKDDLVTLKEFEKKDYILKEDAGEGTRFIKKGEKVKLYIKTGDDYIKVYCYPNRFDFVKAERTLIIYLFEEDFKKSKFNISTFEDKLYTRVDIAEKK